MNIHDIGIKKLYRIIKAEQVLHDEGINVTRIQTDITNRKIMLRNEIKARMRNENKNKLKRIP